MKLAITFTNFGPYHLARLRALGRAVADRGGRLVAYETAGRERRYPWEAEAADSPFEWVRLFPEAVLEDLAPADCARAIRRALDRDQPDAIGIVGYVRPECLAALDWARRSGSTALLLSESQAIDRPRVWWKEAVKRRRVRRFDAALVGGPNHRDYLIELGMPADRIAMGYNAVDNDAFRALVAEHRAAPIGREGLPSRPYFVCAARYAEEKNLERLIWAFARYRVDADPETAWDLVLCGGGELERRIDAAVRASGCLGSIHRPGFLQTRELARWYAFASGFVLPSLSEPWGLVANEAAASGLPLLLSETAGCARTLVPDHPATGRRFDPGDDESITSALAFLAGLSESERARLGRNASAVVRDWGPERFARGFLEAVELADRTQAVLEACR